mmetsp:Transcript_64995/g.121037  ORF Transcript_64995/g.121037 Transcript_64995/m.121037 type:complete len:213 (+) Transcript_64995:67-705(+)
MHKLDGAWATQSWYACWSTPWPVHSEQPAAYGPAVDPRLDSFMAASNTFCRRKSSSAFGTAPFTPCRGAASAATARSEAAAALKDFALATRRSNETEESCNTRPQLRRNVPSMSSRVTCQSARTKTGSLDCTSARSKQSAFAVPGNGLLSGCSAGIGFSATSRLRSARPARMPTAVVRACCASNLPWAVACLISREGSRGCMEPRKMSASDS